MGGLKYSKWECMVELIKMWCCQLASEFSFLKNVVGCYPTSNVKIKLLKGYFGITLQQMKPCPTKFYPGLNYVIARLKLGREEFTLAESWKSTCFSVKIFSLKPPFYLISL